MKKTAMMSKTKSGMSFYIPEELRRTVSGRLYLATMERSSAGHTLVRLTPGAQGRNRFVEHTSSLHPMRLMQGTLEGELASLPEFGATPVSWSHGEADGELCLSLPESRAEWAPYTPRQQTGRYKKKPAVAATPPAEPETPHARLRQLLTEINALITSGEVSDVTLSAFFETGPGVESRGPIRGPILGARQEVFGE